MTKTQLIMSNNNYIVISNNDKYNWPISRMLTNAICKRKLDKRMDLYKLYSTIQDKPKIWLLIVDKYNLIFVFHEISRSISRIEWMNEWINCIALHCDTKYCNKYYKIIYPKALFKFIIIIYNK